MIGVGYFPQRTAGDKNFFVDLVTSLRSRLRDLSIVSVNDGPTGEAVQDTPGGPISILNVRRPLHFGDPERFFHRAGGTWSYHHLHRPWQEILERQLTLLDLGSRLKRRAREGRVDVVHFMDNFGLGMGWLRRKLDGPAVTATALRYDPRGLVYRLYLARSFGALDGVACLSDAYRGILGQLGVDAARIATLRWGPAPAFQVSPARAAAVAARYGLAPGAPLLVWAGFIQQVAEESLRETAALARVLTAQVPDLHFAFALKPESWRDDFLALAGERIHVERDLPDFPAFLARADCLVSPVVRTDSTVAPPLTWIEAMALGTPVATTAALGVDEVVIDGETGVVATSTEALAEPLLQLLAARPRLAGLGHKAHELAGTRFGLEAIADGYAKFFAGAAARRQSGKP
jgi:glycosyltransferase involved in cell wall biosynthesis